MFGAALWSDWPVRLDQLELFLSFFGSKLAAGRRGWNTVRSAEWSSEGDPSRTQKRLFRTNIFFSWGELKLSVNCTSSELQASKQRE